MSNWVASYQHNCFVNYAILSVHIDKGLELSWRVISFGLL